MEGSKVMDVCEFLRRVSDKNPGKHVFALLDNLPSHISPATMAFAESHNITLAFIPKYSPQFNPIEFIWKSLRRAISQIFAKSEWAFKESIRTIFHRLAKKETFAAGWMEKFGHLFSNLLCP